jgi:hypothetical protein
VTNVSNEFGFVNLKNEQLNEMIIGIEEIKLFQFMDEYKKFVCRPAGA